MLSYSIGKPSSS